MSAFNPQHRTSTAGQITIALYRIGQAIEYLLRHRGQANHLSPALIQALIFLRYARPEVRTIGGLAQRLGVTYATTSNIADALQAKGLIARRPLPEDQRVITLHLTPQGVTRVGEVEDVLDEIEAAVTELAPTDQAALQRVSQAIVRRLQQRGYIQVYEMCWGCQFFRPNAHPETPHLPHHCTFVDAPLAESNTYLECPDFVPTEERR